VCLLDLDYNIPVQARDAALGVEDEVLPESDVGREFKLKQLENEGQLDSSYLKVLCRACTVCMLQCFLCSPDHACAMGAAESSLSAAQPAFIPQTALLADACERAEP
jgi:hypothetical protein